MRRNAGKGSLRKTKKRIKKEGYGESTWWDVQRQVEQKRRKKKPPAGFKAWEPKRFKKGFPGRLNSAGNWKSGKWIKASAVRVRKVAGRVVMDIKKAI